MNCVAVLLILLAVVLHMIVLLFASSPINHGIVHARNCSPIGQNVLYCFKRYNCTYNNFLFGSVNSIVSSSCSKSIGDSTFSTANLLSELICDRDGLRDIAINLTKEELLSIIENVCTS